MADYKKAVRSSKTVSSVLKKLDKTGMLNDMNVTYWIGLNCDKGNPSLFVAAFEDEGQFVRVDGYYRTAGDAAEALTNCANDKEAVKAAKEEQAKRDGTWDK